MRKNKKCDMLLWALPTAGLIRLQALITGRYPLIPKASSGFYDK